MRFRLKFSKTFRGSPTAPPVLPPTPGSLLDVSKGCGGGSGGGCGGGGGGCGAGGGGGGGGGGGKNP